MSCILGRNSGKILFKTSLFEFVRIILFLPSIDSNGRTTGNRTLIDIKIDGELFTGCGDNKKLAKMDAAKKVIKYHVTNFLKARL